MVDERALDEENDKVRRLRRLTDLTCVLLARAPMTLPESARLVAHVREEAVRLFPGKESVFDLVLAPRFRRIIAERFVVPGGKTP